MGNERCGPCGNGRTHRQPGGRDLFQRTLDVIRRLRGELAHLVHASGEGRGIRLQVDGECADGDAHCWLLSSTLMAAPAGSPPRSLRSLSPSISSSGSTSGAPGSLWIMNDSAL